MSALTTENDAERTGIGKEEREEFDYIATTDEIFPLVKHISVDEAEEESARNNEDHFDVFRLDNIGIPLCYFTFGCMRGLYLPLLNVYPLDLGATEAQQTTLAVVADIPTAFKIFNGFISDNCAIFGYRRKPYMLGGWVLASLIMFALIATSDLSVKSPGSKRAIPPEEAPSIQWLSASFFILGIGVSLADVMGDSIVAERAKIEPPQWKGHLQSTCYASRFFGTMVFAPFATWVYSAHGPFPIVLGLAIIPLIMVPFVILLWEKKDVEIRSMAENCSEIWNAVCMRSVWQPMGFVYLFNIMQVPNAAWRQFLETALGFTAAQLNSLVVISYMLIWLGTMTYKFFFINSTWRRVYQICILLNGFLSSLQLLLIKQQTFGLSPFLFALGDDALSQFVAGIQFLPIAIMMMDLCPEGSEGASYAMFTTVYNSALMVSPAVGTLLLGIWDVSKESFEKYELSGLFNLSVLTTIIQTLPIFFVGLLPRSREEMRALADTGFGRSKYGGAIFLLILFGSLIYSIVVGALNIFASGWAGES